MNNKEKNKGKRIKKIPTDNNEDKNKKAQDFLKKWHKLAKEVSQKWDNVSLEDELKYQREKD